MCDLEHCRTVKTSGYLRLEGVDLARGLRGLRTVTEGAPDNGREEIYKTGSQTLLEEAIMASFLMTPLLSTAGGRTAELPAKNVRSPRDLLNEFVVILFLTAGPVLGAVIFLMWLGGLLWGLLTSLL